MNTKLCGCGCGHPTPIAARTDSRYQRVKGQPNRFLPGHNLRLATRTVTPPAEAGPGVPRCRNCSCPMVGQRETSPPGWRRHVARGLCSRCWSAARTAGDLVDFERNTRTRDEVLDEWVLLRGEGYTRAQAAERIGMTFAAFDRAYWRAVAAGDPRVHSTNLAGSATMRRALAETFGEDAA